MFEGPVTGNIPEVLDNGEVTDGTHVTAGQLALALTPYAQVTDLAVNTAAAGNNAAAIQSLDDRVTAELASKLDSSALAPAIAPLATAAALATTDGQVAAHGSSIAALQSSLTTGLSNKADQSAFDVLEGVVATKSTPDSVDLKLSNYSTTAAMNGSIASANNATLATVAANYGLKTVVDQHSLDIAARITPLEVDTKVANALLGAVTAAALASELASRDATISGLQASKADASALTAYALLSAVDTSSEVDSKISTALRNAGCERRCFRELPSCEARPGRRVNNSAAGKLQGGELREDCVEGALERGLAGGERGVRGVRGQQRRVGLGGLERRDAGVPASKLRCDEGLGGEAQQRICYLDVYLQLDTPSTVESRAASALASALPARAASRAAVVTAPSGSSLCCAGQRRRHAEHHGRLLLHGGH